MGCGCKGGDTPKTIKSGTNSGNWGKNISVGIISTILGLLLTPVVLFVLIKTMYNTWAGNGLGLKLNDIIEFLKKDKPQEEEDEEINPDDYELVGVDKIN
jgi:predicted Na+-dependent transporter